MKKSIQKAFLFCLIFLINVPSYADKIPWIRIRKSIYRYQSLLGSCTDGNGPGSVSESAASLYFSGEVENGRVTRAYWTDYPDWAPSPDTFMELKPDKIEMYPDGNGRYWLSRLMLDSKAITWAFHKLYPAVPCFGFRPAPISVDASPLTFEFELDAVKEGVYVSYSQRISISGTEDHDLPFEGALQLQQVRW